MGKKPSQRSQAEECFYSAWLAAPLDGADLVREHVFHPTRKWRFDFAFPSVRLAVEIDGRGVGGGMGRHQTPDGVRRDCEKGNAAARLGWRLLHFPATDKRLAPEWVELVKEVLCMTTTVGMAEPEQETAKEPWLGRGKRSVTFTDYARLEQCDAARGLQLYGAPKEKPSFPQWRGIFIHRFLQYAVERGREAALVWARTKKLKGFVKLCERIDTDALPEGRTEVAYAWCPESQSAREVHGWDLDPESEHYTRIDLLAEQYGCPHVVDYKSGSLKELDPVTSVQLLGGALAARARFTDPWGLGPSGSSVPRRYYLSYVGVESDGTLRWRTATVGNDVLDTFDRRSRQLHLKVLESRQRHDRNEPLDYQTGPACDGCELAPLCPAQQKLQAGAGDAAGHGAGE